MFRVFRFYYLYSFALNSELELELEFLLLCWSDIFVFFFIDFYRR